MNKPRKRITSGIRLEPAQQTQLANIQRRTFLRGGLTVGAMAMLTGCNLQDGDQVGLLLYPQHIQYAAIVSAEGLSGLTGIVNYIAGTPIPPVTSALEPVLGLLYVNPYSVELSDVQLPILVPGEYSGSRLLQ